MQCSMEKVQIRDLHINLRKAGKGRPILFLHGAGGVFEWSPFFQRLAQSGELWVPDHPGFGRSDDPAFIRNMSDLAMYYLDFMDQFGRSEGFDVVGHSIGGWLASEVAIRNTSRIRSLTLIAPAGLRVKGIPMGDVFIWNDVESAERLVHDTTMRQRKLAAETDDETTQIMIRNRYAFAKHAWHPRLFNPDLEKWLHRIDVPTQIIWGREDGLIPASYAAAWQARIAPRHITIIPECGHSPMNEKGEETADVIAAFLHEVRS